MKLELAARFLSKIQLTSLLKKLKSLSLHKMLATAHPV
jgi:hypothetical protein